MLVIDRLHSVWWLFLFVTVTALEEERPWVTPETSWLPADAPFPENWQDVVACCAVKTCCSADNNEEEPIYRKAKIGAMPQFTTASALQVLDQAVAAWQGGAGVWPQMSLAQQCAAIEDFLDLLMLQKERMVQAFMWEIGKNRKSK